MLATQRSIPSLQLAVVNKTNLATTAELVAARLTSSVTLSAAIYNNSNAAHIAVYFHIENKYENRHERIAYSWLNAAAAGQLQLRARQFATADVTPSRYTGADPLTMMSNQPGLSVTN